MAELTVAQVMNGMPAAFLAEKAGPLKATVQFHFTGEEASDWAIFIEDGVCRAQAGLVEEPNLTMTIGSGDFLDLITGKLEPMGAFMGGRLQLRGDVALAMRLPTLFERS